MEDELSVGESDHRHANGDPDQPALPTELVLGAPEIRVVLNQRQGSDSRFFLLPDRVRPAGMASTRQASPPWKTGRMKLRSKLRKQRVSL
jgi:hypothetical protein